MENVNRIRGSVLPAHRGLSFTEIADQWRSAVAPNLSPATVRQRNSYLKAHILPALGKSAVAGIDVAVLQELATKLRITLSRKTVINILSAVFAILDYAGRCGVRVLPVRFADIQLGTQIRGRKGAYFTREQATSIIAAAPEPYHTMFALAWATGLRAGEILALTVSDLDFTRRTIHVCKSADDATREIRQTKTPASTATLPMPSALANDLRTTSQNTGQRIRKDFSSPISVEPVHGRETTLLSTA